MQANLRLERGVAADVHQYCRPDDRDALARCVLVVERVGVAGGGHVARGAGPGVGAGPGRRAGAAAEEACGPRWAPVRGRLAPFACPGCGAREDFARKGKRTRPRKLHTAAGTVELILWHVGCRGCGRNFAPLLVILGLSGKRRTDRLSLDLAELGTQMSFARAGRVDAELAGTSATAGQAHNAMADVAALLTGGHVGHGVVGLPR